MQFSSNKQFAAVGKIEDNIVTLYELRLKFSLYYDSTIYCNFLVTSWYSVLVPGLVPNLYF